MRVAVYLVNSISPSLGGNFSYYDKLLRAIDNHEFHKDISICFAGRVSSSKMNFRKEYVELSSLRLHTFFRILDWLKIIPFVRRVFGINIDFCARRDGRRLRKGNVDVVLFPKQFLKEVNDFPFITMNWDAGHKSTYAFPELLSDFDFREAWYQVEMQKALAILVESESSKEEFMRFYSVPEIKLDIVPLFAGGVIDMVVDEKVQQGILGKMKLTKGKYFYYPAQFWAHKNHYNLLRGFQKLRNHPDAGDVALVFSGSDKGNKDYIVSQVKELGLENHVVMLGFISNEEVYTLYNSAVALVMPTFLGPTNMPVIEAQALHTAVICSDLKGHRETNGEGALYVQPTDVDGWCNAMQSVLDDAFRNKLIAAGDRVYTGSRFKIESAIEALEKSLIRISPVRKTFN